MNSKFFDLKKEKQDRIINAALKIFAIHGYRHASTDDIVKEAGISKGLLFHYFGSKLGVYVFLYEYSVRYMTLELKEVIKNQGLDFFEAVRCVECAKLQVMGGYPYMQYFLNGSEYEDVEEVLSAIEEKRNDLYNLYEKILKSVDFSRFSDDIPIEKLCNILRYTISSLLKESILNRSFQMESYYKEIQEYIDFLEKTVYKK